MTYTLWILITASLVGISCGIMGVLLILRRMAMMADAISHTVLLGIVIAYLLTHNLSGIHMVIGAAIVGVLTTFLVQWLNLRGVQHDASIGVVFTTLFAIGVILIATKVGNAHLDVKHALMGEITFIPWNTIEIASLGEIPIATLTLLIILLLVILIIGLFYKEWKITTFDPALAASIGIPVIIMHYLYMTLLSITTVAAFDAVGAIMVVAMLITPAASAYLWTDKLILMFILSAFFGIASAIGGYYFALWIDTSISGSMAFMTGIVFLISFIFSPRHGMLSNWIRPATIKQP